MTPITAKLLLPIIQAMADGKEIQTKIVRTDGSHQWVTQHCLDFTGKPENYRIKPEPKEIWVNEYANTGVAAHTSKDAAVRNAGVAATRKAVRYREVIED